jgi:hypothetical protein
VGGVLGVGGLGDRADHAHPPRAGRDHGVDVLQRDPPDGEPRLRLHFGHRRRLRGVADELEPNRRIVGLGRGGVDRAHAEIVDIAIGDRLFDLVGAVGGATEDRPLVQVLAGRRRVPVGLAQVQHVGVEPASKFGGVVDADNPLMLHRCVSGDLQGLQLSLRLQVLLPDLHDVHPAHERGGQELGQIALLLAGVGAEVEAGQPEPGVQPHQRGHPWSLTTATPARPRRQFGTRSLTMDATLVANNSIEPMVRS